MDVSIHECPHCRAILISDTETCAVCGKNVREAVVTPVVAKAAQKRASDEITCPTCGIGVPSTMYRCRECGTFLSAEVMEVAKRLPTYGMPLPRQAERAAALRAAAETAAHHAETDELEQADFADEADFETDAPLEAAEDDFSYSSGAGEEDYSLASSLEETYDETQYTSENYDTGYEEGEGGDYALEGQPGEYALSETAADDGSAPLPDLEQGEAESDPGQTEAAEPPAQAAESAAGNAQPRATDGADHALSTGADALLSAALQEEKESARRAAVGGRRRLKKESLPVGSFMIYCPQGCRIQVQEKHRGRTGRCPKCKSLFFVPPAPVAAVEGTTENPEAASATTSSKYAQWLPDVRLHRLNPAKLILKPDSLLNQFEAMDIGNGGDHLLAVTVFAGGGVFGAFQEAKKKTATREQVQAHLATDAPLTSLPAPRHFVLGAEQAEQLKLAQPPVPGEESLFANVPVFGAGRIALRAPFVDTPTERSYLSFTLSQFRTFCEMAGVLNIGPLVELAKLAGVPMTDTYAEHTCHYSDTHISALTDITYQKADPALKLKTLGWKCQACGLVISEDSRKKEKVGSKNEASVPKAKCPKCKKPMGDGRLVGLQ